MINYNDYPTLLFTSFTKDDAPTTLPISVLSEKEKRYLSGCKGFRELFSLISIKNTSKKENTNTHFYLDNNMFSQISNDDDFRNRYFRVCFESYIKPKHGVISFRDNGQYVYLLLGSQDTKRIMKKEGRYIAVALFQKDTFIGFEEGIITPGGLDIWPNGFYDCGMDIGGFISFIMITLGYAEDKQHHLLKTEIKEKIYELKTI